MSAFMVSKEHIDALVHLAVMPGGIQAGYGLSWFSADPDSVEWTDDHDDYFRRMREIRREANHATADEVGRMLAFENAASVHYRYPDHDNTDFVPAWAIDGSYTFPHVPRGRRPSPVEGLKLIDCFEYQSCEHPGWKDSEARRFCEALRGKLIGLLPGYEEAPWEWEQQEVTAS